MKITDGEIKKICSSTIYKRGLEYYKEGRVHLRVRKEDSIVAAVDGDELYNVHVSFKDGRIFEFLCTCPYYHTMGTTCKHIVATLKTRQAELNETNSFSSENDLLAARFCSEYSQFEQDRYSISLLFRITPGSERTSYSISLKISNGFATFPIQSTEKFLDCIATNSDYRLSKNRVFSNSVAYFDEPSRQIIEILTEAYENKAASSPIYSPRLLETDLGSATAKRLFPILSKINCEYVIDSISYVNPPVTEDDPDILVDIAATDKNITLSVTESGIALVPDGSWFLFDGKIFCTSQEWQSWFMPIYRTMIMQHRTQLEFAGDNSIDFAAKVLPRLKGRHGVICYGVDELIINEKPRFEIYLDCYNRGVSAVIKAYYGNVSIRIPLTSYKFDKIIIRDPVAEEKVLSHFSNFTHMNGSFLLMDDDDIFHFITQTLDQLPTLATLFLSDSFKELTASVTPEISAIVRYNDKVDLLEMTIDSELSENELSDILNAYYARHPYYRFSDGRYLDFAQKQQTLELLGNLPIDPTGSIKGYRQVSKSYSLFLMELAQNGTLSSDESFSNMLDSALKTKADITAPLDKILRDYQKTGVHWFHQLSKLSLGGILADDMGLGKTIQVIAFIMSEKPEKPALVVTPSSLTYNWLNEIQRFAPEATAKIIDGLKSDREISLEDIEGYDFIITSYALLRRDIQIYQRLDFSYCFIDEAQHIKNPKTMNARAVKRIQAGQRFALTGTPIENSLSELWSIFDFVLPGYLLSHKDFSFKYEKPVSSGKSLSSIENLRNKIKPFILRRMKKDVLSELPEKIENTIFADFEPEQKQIYTAFLAAARKEADAIAATGENTIRILSLLTRLRQICCHPGLINDEYKRESGKLSLLKELVVSAIEAGHRVLIFSQFTSMLNIIGEHLRRLDLECFYLDGATPSAQRLSMANRFNSGEKSVFLISLKAGGTGLNLIGADMVIHYDPWWNPAVMDQASDRAYRIGQERVVQVIKLAARNSIEEQILKLAEKKRGLADGIIRENKNLLSALSREELLNLFNG